MQNDINDLYKNEEHAVKSSPYSSSGANLNYIQDNQVKETPQYQTELEKNTNLKRDEALQNVIAGLPQIEEPSVTISTTHPDLSQEEISKSFTTRDEIMSRLNLMDENYNYTDTYTNYINSGGSPLPGYEWAHQELLTQEGYDNIFKQVDEGKMTYDQALIEAYGKDIMATMGYDLDSVAYWTSNFLQQNYQSPFNNSYLMDQVKQRADEYHQARLAGEYAHTPAKETQLASLVGSEVDELGSEKIMDLFPMEALQDSFDDDDKFMKALHTGQIAAQMRMTQDSKGTWYYLHTDGKLYVLDGQQGDGHGTLKMNGDEFEGIDLNNSGAISFGRNVWKGFTGVFTGIADLGAITLGSLGAILTLGYGDGFDSEDFFGLANSMDSYLADNADWLVGTGYIDLSDKISGQDVWNFAGSMIGTIAGTMTLAGIMGGVGDIGTATSAGSKGTGLIGYGEHLISQNHKVAGSALKGLGTALKWQTGNIGSQSSAITAQGVWGRRIAASTVANFKNALNDYRTTSLQASLYEDGASQEEIFGRTMLTFMANTAIDTLISGGMDDNQVQAYKRFAQKNPDVGLDDLKSLDFLGMTNKEVATATNSIKEIMSRKTSGELLDAAERQATDKAFKKLLFSRAGTIAVNSSMDLIGNIATGAISATGTLKDGKYSEDITDFTKHMFDGNLIARSAVNTLWYSTRSQIKDWNVNLETIGKSNTDLLAHIDRQRVKYRNDPEKLKEITDFKQKYLSSMNDDAVAKASPEEKIIYAMNKTCTNMGEVPDVLQKIIQKNASAEALKTYESLYTSGIALYNSKLARMEKVFDPQTKDGHKFFGFVTTPLTRMAKFLDGEAGAEKAVKQRMLRDIPEFEQMLSNSISLYDNTYAKQLFKITDDIVEKSVPESERTLKTIQGENLVKDKDYKDLVLKNGVNDTYYILPKDGEGTPTQKKTEAYLKVATELKYLQEVDASKGLYKVPTQPDPLSAMNNSEVQKVLYNTVMALSSEQPAEVKQEILSTFADVLIDKKVSPAGRAATLSSVLQKLTETKGQAGEDIKPIMTTDEAAELIWTFCKDNKIGKVDFESSKDLNATTFFEMLYKTGDALMKMRTGKEDQIDLTDKQILKGLETMYKQGKISDEAWNNLTKLQEDYPDFFEGGSHLKSKQKYIETRILKEMFDTVSPKNKDVKQDINSKIDLYLEDQAGKSTMDELKNDPIYKDIVRIAKEYDDITSSTNTVKINEDNRVYIDLSRFNGKTTSEFVDRVIREQMASIKHLSDLDAYREYNSGMLKESKNLFKYQQKNGQILSFDLNKQSERNYLKAFLNDMNYDIDTSSIEKTQRDLAQIDEVRNFRGDSIVLKINRPSNVQELKDQLIETGKITVGDITVDFKTFMAKPYGVDKDMPIDLERAVLDSIELSNIDPAIKVKLNQAPLLNLIPFTPDKEGKYNFTTPMTSALMGYYAAESLSKQAGKESKTLGTQREHIEVNSAGARLPLDKQLSIFFTLDLISRRLLEDPLHNSIPLSKAEAEAFKDKGLVDYKDGDKVISNPKNFWTLEDGDNPTLIFNFDGKAKEGSDAMLQKMQSYIVSEDFNVFRLLPMMFKEVDIRSQGITDIVQTYTTEGYENLPKGFARETGLRILNLKLPWDTADNQNYATFIKDMIANNSTLEYNPLAGAKYSVPTEETYASFDDWYNATKDSTNPYDIIARRYVDTFNDMIKGAEGQERYNNENLLVFCRSTRKALVDAVNDGEEVTSELVNKVKKAIPLYDVSAYEGKGYKTRTGYSPSGTTIRSSGIPSDEAVVSAKSLGGIFNDDNLRFENPDFVDLETVQKAYDLIKDVKVNAENDYRLSFLSKNLNIDFMESDATKILKGLAGNDYYVPIEDVDYFADLIFEDYKLWSDNTTAPPIKEDVIPLLSALWGKNYEAEANKIFNAAKAQNKMRQDTNEVLSKHFVEQGTPSISSDMYKTFAPALEEGEEGLISPEDSNLLGLESRLKNAINNKLTDPKNVYSKLMNNTSDLIDNELTDILDKNVKDIRNLYTSAPYNSETQNLVTKFNSIGLMQTTINTFDALKEKFNGANEKELMNLAKYLTTLNVGVDYAGDTTKFFVTTRDGSLTDDSGEDLMEKFASANLNELLYNMNKFKKDLIGKTIIHTENQDISNNAAIKMTYKDINSEDDLNDLMQKMFENFVYQNNYYLSRGLKTDPETLAQQLVDGEIPKDMAQTLLRKIPSDTYSQLQAQKNMYDNFKENTNNPRLSRAEFNGTFKDTNVIDINTLDREVVQKILNGESDHTASTRNALSQVTNLAFGLGNPDYYKSEKWEAYHNFQENLLDLKIKKPDEELNPQERVINFVLDYVGHRDDIHTIDLLTRNRSLEEMKKELDTGYVKNAACIEDYEGKKKYFNSNELKEIINSLTSDDPKVKAKSPYNMHIAFDTETDLINGKVFNLGMYVTRLTNEGWKTEKYNLFVDYTDGDLNLADKKKARQKFADDYIYSSDVDGKGKTFLATNEGYADTVKAFIDAKGEELKTPDQIKELISSLIKDNKATLIGFNSSKADIPWLKDAGILDDDILSKVTHIDVKTLGESSQALETKTKGSKDYQAEEFKILNSASHGGLNDAEVTMELFKKIGAVQFNIANVRDAEYQKIKDALDSKGILKDIDNDQFTHILKTIDSKLSEAREKDDNLKAYFDRNIDVNTDDVSAATQLFEYAFNKRMADMAWNIKAQMDKDNALTDLAYQALLHNKQSTIFKMYNAAIEKGIDPWEVTNELRRTMQNFGTCDMNTLLEVANSSSAIEGMKERLGITQEEFDKASNKKLFSDLPERDSKFSSHSKDFETFDKLYGTKQLFNHIKSIIDAVGITDETSRNRMIKNLATFYSIKEGADVDELFKDNVEQINTKTQKVLNDLLEAQVGSEDAILHMTKNGLYDLVDAIQVDHKIYDGISNKWVPVDSSMVVLSKEHFKNLTGVSYEQYLKEHPEVKEEGLYSQLIIHPADANHKILPRRIVVNTKLEGNYMQVPETVIEVLGSRDFDGDHLILLTPESVNNKVLKTLCDNLYDVHNVQERVLNFLRSNNTEFDNYKTDNFVQNVIGRDRSILDLCYKADEMLSKGKQITEDSEITKQFENTVAKLLKEYNYSDSLVDKIKKSLWVKTVDLYEVNRDSTPIQFIMNKAIDRNLDDVNALSYSAKQRLKAEDSQLISKDLSYNFIDQTTGVAEKNAIYGFKNTKVSNPYTDLLANGIYGAGVVGKYFDNFEGDSDKLIGVIKNSLNEIPTLYDTNFDGQLQEMKDALDSGHNARAFNIYANILKQADITNRTNLSSDQLMDQLTSPDMLEVYNKLNARLDRMENNLELRNDLIRNQKYWGNDSEPDNITQLTLLKTINHLMTDDTMLYNQNEFIKNSTKGTAFVITGVKKATKTPFLLSEDTIMFNKNSDKQLAQYSRKVYNFKDRGNNDTKLTEGQIFKKGSSIVLGGERIKFDYDTIIEGKTNNQLIAITASPIDNSTKTTSDIGGKGVTTGAYSTDSDIMFVINKPTLKKVVAGNNKALADALNDKASKIETLKIYDEYGKPITVEGYRVKDVSFMPTEDTTSWGKNKERKIDMLHYVMDANTINSLLNFGAEYKDGELSTNIERYSDLASRVYNIMKEKQYQNACGTMNQLKLHAIFNVISDKELQEAYKTDMDPQELKNQLLYNKLLASDLITSQAYTLGEMFKDRLNLENPILNKLFSKDLYRMLGMQLPTASSKNLNIENVTSKANISNKANVDEDNQDVRQMSRATRIHNDVDRINVLNGLENTEDNYFSLFKLYSYLMDDAYVIDHTQAGKLMRNGILPYGTFVPDTANPENSYRHYDVNQTIPDNVANRLVGPSESYKTAFTTSPADLRNVMPRKVDLSTIDPRYLNTEDNTVSYMDPYVMGLINKSNVDYVGYSQNPNILNMLYRLENVNPSMFIEDKKAYLNNANKQARVLDTYMAVGFDDKGNPDLSFSRFANLEGTMKELYNKTKGAIYNYAWYNNVRRDDEYMNFYQIKPKKEVTKAKPTKKEFNKVYDDIKKDFYDNKTGEIKGDNNLEKFRTDQPSAETPRVLHTGEEKTFGTSIWGRQGTKANTELGASVGTAMKNAYAAATFLEQSGLTQLNNLERMVNDSMSKSEFEEFANLSSIMVSKGTEKAELLKYFNTTEEEAVQKLENFKTMYPDVAIAYKNYVTGLYQTLKYESEKTGQPFDTCFAGIISPYKSTSKNYNKTKAFNVLKDLSYYQKLNPTDESNKGETNLVFDFFNSSKATIREMAKLEGADEIKKTLRNEELLTNASLIDDVNNILDRTINSGEKYYISESRESEDLKSVILNKVFDLTGIRKFIPAKANTFEGYKKIHEEIRGRLAGLIDEYNTKYNKELKSYSEFETRAELSTDINESKDAKTIANHYYADMILGQGMIEGSWKFAKDMGSHIAELNKKGYVLVNEYGQEYVFKGTQKPITSAPLSNLIANAEIAYNSYDENRWNQFMLEKILSGDCYLMRKDVADHLDKNYYTQELPGPVKDTLSKISKWSASFQMALPTKILNRVISFTGFDYSMGIMYDPKVLKYIGEARRQLMAAYMSKGTQMTDEMKQYMMREGQPIGLTGKDFVTFSEEMNAPKMLEKVLNTLTDPLEFQNHLGRYAIYLTALEGFKNKDPNYGPLYYAKEAIDRLDSDEDKAMYVMDYMLGSPGGFPQLAKKTSGIMMYATFPMNFGRTMGAYGMSLGRLFKEGFTSENSKQWMRCAVTPSMGLAGVTAVGMLLTSWICDLFGIDGEEKDKMVKDLDTIDIVGTVLGGTPAKSSSSMNPLENLYDMTIEPFTNVNNDNLIKKLFGVVNTNIIGHFNPAIKYPVEMLSGYDLYGSSLVNTKYSYNAIENGIRKALGFVIGTGVSNSIVDQFKIDKYTNDRNFSDSLKLGITRGVSYDLGNQKSYKKDTTNYYNNIYKINNYKYKESNGMYSADAEDYIQADSMERIRNYKSKYGSYEENDYKRISKLLRKAIEKREPATTVYSIIISEYNKGVSETTLKTVLNNNSIARKLDQLKDKDAYLRTLSTSEYKKLVQALDYEELMYPYLKEFFPNKTNLPTYNIKTPKYYKKSSGSGRSYPKTYYPKKAPQVYWYPNNGYSNKKISTKKPKASIERVEVKVSPEMAVWTKDYNKTKELNHWKDSDYNRVKPMSHGGGK